MPGSSQIDVEDVGGGRDRVARVKIVLGVLGADGGDLSSTNPLPTQLIAGAAVIGKVGIDQATPGTTNAVATIAGQSGVAGGAGVAGATVQRVVIATDQTTIPTTPGDSTAKTYSAAISGLAIAAAATDFFEIKGSATKTVKVRRITLSGIATAAGALAVLVLKRSTANSVGTSSSPLGVPHDSADDAATAVVKAYTANPTTGTLVGAIRAIRPTVTTAAGAIPNVTTAIELGGNDDKYIVLRGTAESIVLNLAGATVAGLVLDIWVEFTEEA